MKRKNLHFTSLLAIIIVLGMTACSPQKLLETGNYDDALSHALNKVSGKKKKKEKHVAVVEDAFQKANARDMAAINRLKAEGVAENWSRIYDIAQRIAYRQSRIEPLLPLHNEHGFQSSFTFVKTDIILREAKEKAAAALYAKAGKLLDAARLGDKDAARAAYSVLRSIDKYYNDYRNQNAMMKEATDLGIVHVLFKVENNAPVFLPRDFESELLRMSIGELDSRWKKFYTRPSARPFDYEVVMNITNIAISPERIQEREFEEIKEVADGVEYVRDKRGNIKLDSLGRRIEIPRTKRVNAWVLETFQNKAAQVEGRLEYYDTHSRRLVSTKPMAAEAIFENYAATFRGDRRALSSETCRIIDNRPVPFPSDAALLFDAAEQLRPAIRRHIANARLAG